MRFYDYFVDNLRNCECHGQGTCSRSARSQFAKRLKSCGPNGVSFAPATSPSRWASKKTATRATSARRSSPSLTLIHKMCETLRVSPNELLGFAEYCRSTAGAPAFAEDTHDEICADAGVRRDRQLVSSLAWRLASEAVGHPQRAPRQVEGGGRSACERARNRQAVSAAAIRPVRHGGRDRRRHGLKEARRQAQGGARRADPRLHRAACSKRRPAAPRR